VPRLWAQVDDVLHIVTARPGLETFLRSLRHHPKSVTRQEWRNVQSVLVNLIYMILNVTTGDPLLVSGDPVPSRQRFVREQGVIDLLVTILAETFQPGRYDVRAARLCVCLRVCGVGVCSAGVCALFRVALACGQQCGVVTAVPSGCVADQPHQQAVAGGADLEARVPPADAHLQRQPSEPVPRGAVGRPVRQAGVHVVTVGACVPVWLFSGALLLSS
jgi:hypothetical protein